MKIIAFGFENNISETFLNNFPADYKFLLKSSSKKPDFHRSIEELIDFLKWHSTTRAAVVTGFGLYSGRDRAKFRIESICKNRFRNSSINTLGKDYYNLDTKFMSEFLKNEDYKITSGLGNSWCNLVCYRLCEEFGNSIGLNFVHINS